MTYKCESTLAFEGDFGYNTNPNWEGARRTNNEYRILNIGRQTDLYRAQRYKGISAQSKIFPIGKTQVHKTELKKQSQFPAFGRKFSVQSAVCCEVGFEKTNPIEEQRSTRHRCIRAQGYRMKKQFIP